MSQALEIGQAALVVVCWGGVLCLAGAGLWAMSVGPGWMVLLRGM